MAVVQVLNVPPSADESSLREFFAFCGVATRIQFNERDLGPGELASVCEAAGGNHSDDSQAALVEFEHEEGAATALLLNNSLLDDRPIFLVSVRSANTELHPKEAGTAVPKAGGNAREDGGSEAAASGDNRARGLSMWAGAGQGLLEGGGALFSSAFTKANEATAAATQKMQAWDQRYDLRGKLTPSEGVKRSFFSGFERVKNAVLEAEAAHREFSAKLVREAHGDNSDFNTFNPYSEPLDAPEWGHSRQPGVKLATTSVPASRQDAGGSQLGGDATGVEQPATAHGGNEQDEL